MLCLVTGASLMTQAQSLSLPPSGDNQKCIITQYIGSLAHVTVRYSSPDVDGRTGKIWGELVPYGLTDLGFGLRKPAPWRAGANENTVITFSHDVLIEGHPLQAGTYGLHLIVQESGPWTWIFSHNSTAWGSFFYSEEEDALRVQVTPTDGAFHEWLTYEFTDRGAENTALVLKWEHKHIPMRIAVSDPHHVYVSTFKKELQGSAGFDAQNWAAAAMFMAQRDYQLDVALQWADIALSGPFVGVENWNTLQTRAFVLMKMGKRQEYSEVLMRAVQHATAQPFQIHGLGRQLISLGYADIALEVFEASYKRFHGVWPTNVGMARGLSAVGRYHEALEYAKRALAEAPDEVNRLNLQKAVENLSRSIDIN